ncbi:hypothetical protein V6N13_032662 [Hibiscus sabdariffa]|uniref:Uncharacterized protein n=2 Tax=Hibiscus sabdariffa TaxID=183260 RepID=A0ABR2FCD9_9ROSI
MQPHYIIPTKESHSLAVPDVRFRPNSTIVATSSYDKTVQILDTSASGVTIFLLNIPLLTHPTLNSESGLQAKKPPSKLEEHAGISFVPLMGKMRLDSGIISNSGSMEGAR